LLDVQGFSFALPGSTTSESWHTGLALFGGYVDADTNSRLECHHHLRLTRFVPISSPGLA
jgi:hypothetical protein